MAPSAMADVCLGAIAHNPHFFSPATAAAAILRVQTGRLLSHSLTCPPVIGTHPLILASLAWLCWAWVSRGLLNNPRRDPIYGVLMSFIRLYARAWHKLEVQGRENVPQSYGPLLIVANHTAGIDPILMQAVIPFEIRWMMAKDMMEPSLDPLWKWADVIPVDRTGKDTSSAKDAIAHLRAGHVIGVFPEGRLERPERHLLPFLPGLGVMIKRTRASVLPIVIEGTPQTETAWASVLLRSESKLRVFPVIDYGTSDLKSNEIVEDLRRRFIEWTSWPTIDAPDQVEAMRE